MKERTYAERRKAQLFFRVTPRILTTRKSRNARLEVERGENYAGDSVDLGGKEGKPPRNGIRLTNKRKKVGKW